MCACEAAHAASAVHLDGQSKRLCSPLAKLAMAFCWMLAFTAATLVLPHLTMPLMTMC